MNPVKKSPPRPQTQQQQQHPMKAEAAAPKKKAMPKQQTSIKISELEKAFKSNFLSKYNSKNS